MYLYKVNIITLLIKLIMALYCSCCKCIINHDCIKELLSSNFINNIINIILNKIISTNYSRLIHSPPNGPPHVVCQKCEEIITQHLCMMDTNIFKCPHDGCDRIIIAG
jgi:hypothetical protein